MWLKLQWTRFFTLAGWNWKLAPRPGFDFEVNFPCPHSECNGSHTLLVRVVDKGYQVLEKKHGEIFSQPYDEPNPALFGDGPQNTYWEMVHGAGGGREHVDDWMTMKRWTDVSLDVNALWKRAAHD